MPPNLSEPLKRYLMELRADPSFREILRSLQRQRLTPWRRAGASEEEKHHAWIYETGVFDGQSKLVVDLLGDDSARRSDNG